jgi:hypothetical protein
MKKECRTNFEQSNKWDRARRGISLIEKIPLARNCTEALIPMIFCSKLSKTIFNSQNYFQFEQETGYTVDQASQLLLQKIINVTESQRAKCFIYSLEKVISVKKAVENWFVFYEMQILLQPGNAIFEGYLRLNQQQNRSIYIYSRILRLSTYGQQSKCVSNKIKMLGFCYCKSI